MTEASSQDELIDTLQSAVTELHRTSDSQKRTIEETEKQVEILQLIKSDHNNMVCKCRVVFNREPEMHFYFGIPRNTQYKILTEYFLFWRKFLALELWLQSKNAPMW